jgi:hypothetical protein
MESSAKDCLSMKSRLLTSLAALLASASVTLAQAPAAAPLLPGIDSSPSGGCHDFGPGGDDNSACVWGSAEYLFYWVRSAPLSVPTLTTFGPNTPSATTGFGGALGVQGTTVVSPDHFSYDPLSGGRVLIGAWLDNDRLFGVEASGFLTETQASRFALQSTPTGVPSLRVPFVNVPPGAGFPLGESSFVLADPDFASGGQAISSRLRLWGAEGHALLHVSDNNGLSVSLLGGFRYLDLQEGLSIASRETSLGNGFGTFVGTDDFRTRNQFYGGQLGAKVEMSFGRFFAAVLGDVSLGENHESVTINGISIVTPVGGPAVITPGGIFAQTTNIGRQTHDEFAVVPEVQLRLGAKLTNSLRAFVGYDFVYVSNVARPGDQIDRTLNFTTNQAVNGSPTPLPLLGAARPAPLFNHTDFWTQGITFGMELRF